MEENPQIRSVVGEITPELAQYLQAMMKCRAEYKGVSWLVTSGMDPQEAVKMCQEVQDKVCGREDKKGKSK